MIHSLPLTLLLPTARLEALDPARGMLAVLLAVLLPGYLRAGGSARDYWTSSVSRNDWIIDVRMRYLRWVSGFSAMRRNSS